MTDQETKTLTPEQEEGLFVAAEKKLEAVTKAEEALKKAQGVLSGSVKNIHDNCGPGPFNWRGKDLRISKRKDVYSMKSVEAKPPRAIGA